jgi:predicted DNA-binding transcriptional regulator AlpA
MPDNTNIPQTRLLDEFYTEQELAAEFGKSQRTVTRMREQRTGPPWRRLGVTVIYPKAAAREWMHSGVSNPVRARPRRNPRTPHQMKTPPPA